MDASDDLDVATDVVTPPRHQGPEPAGHARAGVQVSNRELHDPANECASDADSLR
jgi:hypothetical protein